MYNDIMTQNIKLIDEKLIINDKEFEVIDDSKYISIMCQENLIQN